MSTSVGQGCLILYQGRMFFSKLLLRRR